MENMMFSCQVNLQEIDSADSIHLKRSDWYKRQDIIDSLLNLLCEYAGFKASSNLQKKIDKVLRNISDVDLKAWLQTIEYNKNVNELAALIEDLTNHETYFFRDETQFNLIYNKVLPEFFKGWQPGRNYKFRIWSAACASGEEAFSLAILFLDYAINKGFAGWRSGGDIELSEGLELEIIGSDISRQSIRKASEAVYMSGGLASFRNMPKKYWRYFEKIDTGDSEKMYIDYQYYRPIDAVRKRVRFNQYNLLQKYNSIFGRFDLVLCRNMLIYIDIEKQNSIQKNLYESLLRGGCLIMSAVDRQLLKKNYKELWDENAVAFLRK